MLFKYQRRVIGSSKSIFPRNTSLSMQKNTCLPGWDKWQIKRMETLVTKKVSVVLHPNSGNNGCKRAHIGKSR